MSPEISVPFRHADSVPATSGATDTTVGSHRSVSIEMQFDQIEHRILPESRRCVSHGSTDNRQAISTPIPDCFQPVLPSEAIQIMFGRCRRDSFIGIGSRRPIANGDEVPHWLYTCSVARLESYWTAITQFVPAETQYLLQNSLLPSALTNGTADEYEQAIRSGRPMYFRATNRNVRELANIFVDLDVGRSASDMSASTAAEEIVRKCSSGKLPIPTLAGFSGRGLYLVYNLHDEEGLSILRTRATERLWRSVSRALIDATGELQSDKNASRFANWYKSAGTVDSRTNRQVVYGRIDGFNGIDSPVTYSLDGLAKTLGIANNHRTHIPKTAPVMVPLSLRNVEIGSSVKTPCVEAGSVDASQPHRKRCSEILRLHRHRGGMREGCRHMTLRHYFFSRRAELRSSGMYDYAEAQQIAFRETVDLNNEFQPPLSQKQLRYAMVNFGRTGVYRVKNQTVAHDLRVSENEVTALGLTMLIPSSYHAKLESQARLRQERRKRTEQYAVELLRRRVPVKRIARMFRTSPRTIRRWREKHR